MLKSIKKISESELKLNWIDGHESTFTLEFLRKSCPCASCKGETVLLHQYSPMPQVELPGRNEIKNISQVGSYAIQFFWKDNHDTGIFSYEFLRSICQCKLCQQKLN